jgi:hypothetical protein
VVQVVAVFGVSGVGKSWLISRFAAANVVAHAEASRLIREAKEAIDGNDTNSEELRKGPILDNQKLLIQAFAALPASSLFKRTPLKLQPGEQRIVPEFAPLARQTKFECIKTVHGLSVPSTRNDSDSPSISLKLATKPDFLPQ